jgi:hypothetical protein
VDALDEVDPGLERVDVHEDPLGPELVAQAVIEPARMRRGVVAVVADEDSGRARPAFP